MNLFMLLTISMFFKIIDLNTQKFVLVLAFILNYFIYLKKLTKEESDDWKDGEGRQDYVFSQFGK